MKTKMLLTWCLAFAALSQATGQECSQLYTFNITDKTTYNTSCGIQDESDWKVVQNSCNFYTPVMVVNGAPGDSKKTITVRIRLSNSGNLDEKDFAWIFYYVNGKVEVTKTIRGDEAGALVVLRDSLSVPPGSTFKMRLAIVCDEPNEYWKLSNGDLTLCVKAAPGEKPLAEEQVEGKITLIREREIVKIIWNAPSGADGNYFKVERSKNGVDYEFAGYVKDNRNDQALTRYSFIDAGCFKPVTWYRITRVDMRGNGTPFGKPASIRF